MIETAQTVTVACGIDDVWTYVRDIRNWAQLMPGLQDCDIRSDDDSHWVLKVGVGGMVRTVKVDVHVDQWDGPGRVLFSYQLQGDPVRGGGSYTAIAQGPAETEMTLAIRVEGSGPMAPMWEAMGGPLLPKFALAFAEQLRDGIEAQMGASPEATAGRKRGSFFSWLLGFLRRLFANRQG